MYFNTYFTTQQVTKITGINRKTLHYWISRKFIIPSTTFERISTGYHIWDFKDVVALCAIQKLRRIGITLYDKPLISNLVKCIQSTSNLERLSTEAYLITDGSMAYIRQGNESKTIEGDFFFVIRVGKIVDELKKNYICISRQIQLDSSLKDRNQDS